MLCYKYMVHLCVHSALLPFLLQGWLKAPILFIAHLTQTLFLIYYYWCAIWSSHCDFDTFRHISVHFGTFRYISVHFGTFRYISVHFDTFRHISVHFGTFPDIPLFFLYVCVLSVFCNLIFLFMSNNMERIRKMSKSTSFLSRWWVQLCTDSDCRFQAPKYLYTISVEPDLWGLNIVNSLWRDSDCSRVTCLRDVKPSVCRR